MLLAASAFILWVGEHETVLATAATAIGTAVTILWSKLSTLRVPKSWVAEEAKGPVAPLPPPTEDRQSMLARMADNELHTRWLVAVYSLSESDRKLRETTDERDQLREAVRHERAVNDELMRAHQSLRLQVAHLQLALDSGPDVIDVVPIDDFGGEERVKTLRPPRLLNAPRKD